MIDKGKINFVAIRSVGSSLDGDHAAAETEITVDNTFPFDEKGGQLAINGTTYSYTGYDDEASTISLTSGLVADADDGEQVTLLPESTESYANVTLDGSDAAIDCLLTHHMAPWVPLGARTPELAETVTVHRGVDGWEVLNVLGQRGVITESSSIDDSAGDLDPSADVVFLDGPPTHYRSPDGDYVDYATMLAAAGTDWAAAVSGLVFDNGSLTIPFIDVQPDGWTTTGDEWLPAWLVPTNGSSCRLLIDGCVADPSEVAFDSILSRWDAPAWMEYNVVADDLTGASAWNVDLFGMQHFFRDESDPAGTGTYKRQWQYHVGVFSDSPASLPADAVYWADTTDFQVNPFTSLNQSEAEVETLSYVAFCLNEPVLDYWTRGTTVPGSPIPVEAYGAIEFNLTGVRVVRE